MNNKFKTIDPIIVDNLYENVRFNNNTNGNHIEISNGVLTEEKINHAILTIFALQNSIGNYEEAKLISEKDNQNMIVKNMLNISKQKVVEYSGENYEL